MEEFLSGGVEWGKLEKAETNTNEKAISMEEHVRNEYEVGVEGNHNKAMQPNWKKVECRSIDIYYSRQGSKQPKILSVESDRIRVDGL
jgi:hypothetical protein